MSGKCGCAFIAGIDEDAKFTLNGSYTFRMCPLHESAESMREALTRISYAKADCLDHQQDVLLIERMVKLAKQTIAKASGPGKNS